MTVAFGELVDEKDFSSISTVAEMDGETYVLRGKKRFVLNTPLADAYQIMPVR